MANKLSALGFFVEQLRNCRPIWDALLNPRPRPVAEAPVEAPVAAIAAATAIEVPELLPLSPPRPVAAEPEVEAVAEIATATEFEVGAEVEVTQEVVEAIAEIDKAGQAVAELPTLMPPPLAPSDAATRLVGCQQRGH